ncbi:molybdopterin-containing oxidoreductase family protein [Gordonibacter urolithinfaciens]|uniref:Molybdopterin-dependent oxidoreductase n=1 Tax=Gordonibacter urolithinfaciens TaxID=1335613 RepID=A0A6N8IFB2_9ACTN|nr:molybdopterin-dependent oxidoreductase [Gordonibacter urolithinfaciens]MVM54982.1 molybdopterin-dependent oxidoreductase [Gordonibacter urolithinfaciens]MVN14604.1 molybdopterin-dependent oxidoreductase [Gordonibacter urolithinfaciens]MVN37837.1 molybdopterin-dependent oxidoreductase [Gordonibacter urolithinfaciens]MVN55671.1 molybdopterin-dependent oxidoreductase [Gordonibacter urolithinfaciens]MVN61523.1 molybdopterin-dependent oxidoreductase [Gordonibacter urolithinfaciens]
MSRESVVEKLGERHEGVDYFYTTCHNNGCWDATCLIKCSVKDDKIVAIEPDDSVNPGVAREDDDENAVQTGMLQARACPMGHAWRQELYSENRLLYPMKRVGGKGSGKGRFERISWDEALDTIAGKMKQMAEENPDHPWLYYCYYVAFESSDFPFASYLPGTITGWGDHSTSGSAAAEDFHLGVRLTDCLIKGTSDAFPGFEAPDLLNSKLVVLWGFDPMVSWFGHVPYYMKLAQERGCKFILIDPVYNVSAEALGAQWIPIRPGTDTAFGLAVAYVLYTEDLYDHEYVAQWVEPDGFEEWRKYVVGEVDGVAHTPEWAEPITGIPAETIGAFARYYASMKPVHLQQMYGVSKRNLGDYAAAVAMLLQAMTGNLSIPGGCEGGGANLVTQPRLFAPVPDTGQIKGDVVNPITNNNNKVTEVMHCQKLYAAGEITEDEFRRRIGCPADSPLPNLKMAIIPNNYINNQHHVSKRMQGFADMEFSWGWQYFHDQPSIEFLDIVLPSPVIQFESTDMHFFGINRFWNSPSGMMNYFLFAGKGVNPPGEVRSKDWVWMELARRLGFADKYCPKMLDVTDWRDWDEQVIERIYKPAYEKWAEDENGLLGYYEVEPPSWEEFQKLPIVRVPGEPGEWFYPFKNTVEWGRSPFKTPSGKIEFESSFVKGNDLTKTRYGGQMDAYPRWQPTYQDLPANDSYYHPWTKNFPLSMVTPVSTYRQHSSNDQNPWLKGDCYEHMVRMSLADAADRGIKTGDRVLVYNQFGEVEIIAYVSSKLLPGTVSIGHGEWSKFDNVRKSKLMPYGIDEAGNCNLLIGDTHLPHVVGALLTAGLVEIRKVGE